MWSNLAYMKAKGGSGGGEECSSGQGEAHTLEAKDTDSCSRSTGELCYIKKKHYVFSSQQAASLTMS